MCFSVTSSRFCRSQWSGKIRGQDTHYGTLGICRRGYLLIPHQSAGGPSIGLQAIQSAGHQGGGRIFCLSRSAPGSIRWTGSARSAGCHRSISTTMATLQSFRKTNSVGGGFRMFFYYTNDGTNPEGAGGVGLGTTQTAEMTYQAPNTTDGNNWWGQASIPKPAGTIKYKIGIYKNRKQSEPVPVTVSSRQCRGGCAKEENADHLPGPAFQCARPRWFIRMTITARRRPACRKASMFCARARF